MGVAAAGEAADMLVLLATAATAVLVVLCSLDLLA